MIKSGLKFLLFSVSVMLASIETQAGEIVLAGTYQGKNIYVQNPFTGNLQDFCAVEVFVNNSKATINLNASAFEIDLSFLQSNDEVLVKIVHKDDCKPKVLNPNVIKSNTHFHFIDIAITDQKIVWTTKGEKVVGRFYIEHFWHNSWIIVNEVDSKGGLGTNHYEIAEKHHSGTNKYRIRFKDATGQFFYSKVLEHASQKEPITFSPKKAVNTLVLSQHTHYEICDANGTSLLKGSGIHISVSSLKPGEYFLNIDNRTEKFTKR
jgi:3-dehydroquinate dehydratase